MSEEVTVSILMPVRNEERHVRHAIVGMQAQRFAEGIEFLVVDGDSSDTTQQIAKALAEDDSRIVLLQNPGRTIPRALNIGLAKARGEFVVRMDAHTRYPADYVERGVRRLREGGVDWVSGPALAQADGLWSRRVALALAGWLGTGGAAFRRDAALEREVDSGFTGVWRRTTLNDHGGWDEAWRVNEDAELAARFREVGRRIVCVPEMAARYIPRDSIPALARQYTRYGYYRAKTSRRHPSSARPSHVFPPAVALATIGSLAPFRPLRQACRTAMGVYTASLLAASVQAGRDAAWSDAAALPIVFATMHLSWGFGFLGGCLRFGLPRRAPTIVR